MNLMKTIIDDIARSEQIVSTLCADAEDLINNPEYEPCRFDPKLSETFVDGTTSAKRGDIVFHAKDHTVSMATGEHDEIGRPISIHKKGKKALEPEFLKVGPHAENLEVRRAASKMATKYPDRRILIYGEHAKKD